MRLLFFLGVFFLLASPISAQSFIAQSMEELKGDFVIGENMTLKQSCGDCTYINISQVLDPANNIVVSDVVMIQQGSSSVWDYNLDGSLLTSKGDYTVLGYGDPDGDRTEFSYTFYVKPDSLIAIDIFDTTTQIIFGLIFLVSFVYWIAYGTPLLVGLLMFLFGIYSLTYEQQNIPWVYSVFVFVIGMVLMLLPVFLKGDK
jgi:hypothetical protein